MSDNPYSTRANGMRNGVSGFVDSHFSWRRPRGVKFSEQRELILTSLMVQTASFWLVWTWRNCVAKMHPPGPVKSPRWIMVRENFEIAPFFMGNRRCRSVTLFYNVTSPSETLLSEENRYFCKKRRIFVFFVHFLGWSLGTP